MAFLSVFCILMIIIESEPLLYDGNVPFSATHNYVPSWEANKLINFRDYIHPKIQINYNTQKLINIGDTIEIGTILVVSYPLFIYVNVPNELKGRKPPIRTFDDQLKYIYSNPEIYYEIIEYINNIPLDIKKMMNKVGAHLSPNVRGIFGYTHMIPDNGTQPNCKSSIYPITGFAISNIIHPVITWATKEILNGDILMNSGLLKEDIDIVLDDQKRGNFIRISDMYCDIQKTNEALVPKLQDKIFVEPYYSYLEDIKCLEGILKFEYHFATIILKNYMARRTNMDYLNDVAINYYDNIVKYGTKLCNQEDYKKCFVWYIWASMSNIDKHFDDIKIKLWNKNNYPELVRLFNMKIISTTHVDTRMMFNVIDILTMSIVGYMDQVNYLSGNHFRDLMKKNKYYEIYYDIIQFHKERLQYGKRDNTNKLTYLIIYQCLFTLINIYDDINGNNPYEMFIQYFWDKQLRNELVFMSLTFDINYIIKIDIPNKLFEYGLKSTDQRYKYFMAGLLFEYINTDGLLFEIIDKMNLIDNPEAGIDDRMIFMYLGGKYFEYQKYDKAYYFLNIAFEALKDDWRYLINGLFDEERQMVRDIIVQYGYACLMINNIDTIKNLGEFYTGLGVHKLFKAIGEQTGNVKYYIVAIYVEFNEQDIVINVDDDDYDILVRIGNIYVDNGRYNVGFQYFNEAIKLDLNRFDAFYSYIVGLCRNDMHKKAAEMFVKIPEINHMCGDCDKEKLKNMYDIISGINMDLEDTHLMHSCMLKLKEIKEFLDTKHPTNTPSISPTKLPSMIPTLSPTLTPTNSPTLSPTASPSDFPTSSPTVSPSFAPTTSPTAQPTPAPTNMPTTSPTKPPIKQPTNAPTASPSTIFSALVNFIKNNQFTIQPYNGLAVPMYAITVKSLSQRPKIIYKSEAQIKKWFNSQYHSASYDEGQKLIITKLDEDKLLQTKTNIYTILKEIFDIAKENDSVAFELAWFLLKTPLPYHDIP